MSSGRGARVVATLGNVQSIGTHSGVAYFLWWYGQAEGFVDGGLRLDPRALRKRRALWNLAALLTAGKARGYQYSRDCMRQLWSQRAGAAEPSEVISLFPLLPPDRGATGMAVSFYIDATLRQYFEAYGEGKRIGRRVAREAVAREGDQYHRAQRIVCRSRWAARSVVKDYGIAQEKVHVIRSGANLCEDRIRGLRSSYPEMLKPIRLGFVGKDWRRKNLLFVLQVAERLRARGHATEVLAVGVHRQDAPRHDLLRLTGFVAKQGDMAGFGRLLQSMHFGCLFSKAEALGLSNVECLRLGVPVLGWDVGGIADTVPEGLGHLFPAGATPDEVADVVEGYVRCPQQYAALRERVGARAETFSWAHTIGQFQAVWAGSRACSYASVCGE